MDYEWDEKKNQANIAKHGIDFTYAIKVFEDTNRLEWEDSRCDYGEKRYVTIGRVDSFCFTLIYTPRQKKYRIISARGANRNERHTYQKYYENT